VSISSVAAAFFYNAAMKNWDVIVIGGGIIGLSLSIELRKKGASVLVVERGEPGREASYAAGGMLVECLLETPSALQPLAMASARMYPEFVHALERSTQRPLAPQKRGRRPRAIADPRQSVLSLDT
jgi:glycine oxidase